MESRLRWTTTRSVMEGGANYTFCFAFSLVENMEFNRKVRHSETGLHAVQGKFKHIQSHTQTHIDIHPAVQLKDFPCP